MNTAQLLYSGGVLVKGQYEKHADTIRSEVVRGYNSVSTGATLVGTTLIATALASKMQEGALYSFGAEPVVGDKKFGFVASSSESNLRGIISGSHGFYTPGARGNPYSMVAPGSKAGMEANVRSIFSPKMGAGIMAQSALSTLIPAGFTLYFGADAYANDGMTGLGKYMVADTIGNYYGTKAALNTFEVANATKANNFLGLAGNVAVKEGEYLQRIAPILGSGMIGRMLPTLGGIMGATIGMEVGATIGSAATSLIGSGGPSDTSGAILGGLLGTVAGAKFGSAALSGIPSALIAGIGIAATKTVVDRNLNALKSGFNTQRGLNFAGETAEYFTQNAVTMRERAVQSMNRSNMNARSAFGQEASLMHMNRDMFSQYKRPLR